MYVTLLFLDQSSKNIVWIIVSVVAVVSALVLFVFAKLSHRQHALKQRNRLHREDIQGNDSVSLHSALLNRFVSNVK